MLYRASDEKSDKVKSKTNIIFWTSHQDTRDNKPHMCLQECTTQCPIFCDRNGQHSNPRCSGMPETRTQVRGCYNITFICTPTNQETVSVLEKTQANKTFRT